MPRKRQLQMCISYAAFPAKGEKTSIKNWGKVGKMDIDERVVITETPSRNQVNISHTMIDLMEEKIMNTRFTPEELEKNNVLPYFLNKYQQSIAQARDIYRAKYSVKDDPKAKSDNELIAVRMAKKEDEHSDEIVETILEADAKGPIEKPKRAKKMKAAIQEEASAE